MIVRILVLYHATYDIVHATGKNMHVIIKPLFWEASLYIYIPSYLLANGQFFVTCVYL